MHSSSFNQQLLSVLRRLKKEIEIPDLLLEESKIILMSGITPLVTITPSDILLGKSSIQTKLVTSARDALMKGDLPTFIEAISGKVVRLNHLGISYFCDNVEAEIRSIKKITENENLSLFIEESNDSSMEWLFTGDNTEWQNPLFEIVLNKKIDTDTDYWRPHFQIDFDTTLSIEELTDLSDRYLEKDFFKWQLAIPKIGTVLAMGILGEAQGIKLALGIGTSLRKPQFQRQTLQEL